jgi:hypothetical protein
VAVEVAVYDEGKVESRLVTEDKFIGDRGSDGQALQQRTVRHSNALGKGVIGSVE